ncbi:carbohydrate-binding module family 50 protein [Cylindrobasidium torrendii FP15055 ss-10]|uniref:Carbohydrate-binding module family 50 protein n=1 Tax=Cylindrobasidium torrendii FP15055 ss-10 TaxID=1314674 RepID=A0A0D7B778_9AGAR|nr:carbohydrate-binding module family 50 protein [Cylindrobasidium torrendii FP15055 ss-10]
MLSVAAIALLPFLANTALAGSCVRSYTVKEGDICDSISAAKNVSTYQLATINKGYIDNACSNLQPDDEICIGYEGEDCDQTYVVKADDTCEAVANAASIDLATLLNNNPNVLADCSNLYIGEVLAVCSEVIVPPANGSANTAVPTTATPAQTSTSASIATTSSVVVSPSASAFFVPPTQAAAVAATPSADSSEWDESGDPEDDSLPWCDEL